MTKDKILNAAYAMAVREGFESLTRDAVAAEAYVSKGAINHHFHTIEAVRNDVMEMALTNRDLKLIAQGIAARNGVALTAPKELQLEALTSLAQ